MAPNVVLAAGTLLGGRYRVERLLGQGGMGAVFEATQEGLGRRVAVKLLDPQLAADPSQLERFRREGEVVAALGHPNIVQVTDFQHSEQGPFLVMELLRGQSLGALLDAERTLPPNRIAFIAAQALSALAAAHRAGVVHRDIKPDNIFLLSEAAVPDSVKVLDFGIAKLVADNQSAKLTGTGTMLGTPSFMAPEQARGAVDVDARADVYAVGATMYQALTGRLPHEAASVPALLFAIVEQQPTPLRELRPDLPPDYVAVVERAMAKDRNVRFASADEMRAALSPWSGLPVAPGAVSTTAPTLAGTLPSPVATSAAAASAPASAHPQTPPVSGVAATLPSAPAASKSGTSPLTIVMGSIVALVAIVGAVFVVIFYMKSRRDEIVAREEHRAAVIDEKREEKRAAEAPEPSAGAVAGSGAQPQHEAPEPSAGAVAGSGPQARHEAPNAGTSASTSTSASSSSTSAPTAPTRRRYGGARGSMSGFDFGNCPSCDWQAYKEALRSREPEISACFKASELEPPVHENPEYEIGVTAAGALHSFKVLGEGSPKLDRCLRDILFRTPLHKPSGGSGSFKISFRGECVPGWVGQCK